MLALYCLSNESNTVFHNNNIYQDEKKQVQDRRHSRILYSPIPESDIFTMPDEVKLLVLSPVYLGIHAACAQVTHISGKIKYIEKLNRDMGTLCPSTRMVPLQRRWDMRLFNFKRLDIALFR